MRVAITRRELQAPVLVFGDGKISPYVIQRFKQIATDAGSTLDHRPCGETPMEFWVHKLFDYCRERKLIYASPDSTVESGTILGVNEASATYCAFLDTELREADALGLDGKLHRIVSEAYESASQPAGAHPHPEDLLSEESRKRIQRAYIEGDRFVWEAESLIENRSLDPRGTTAEQERNNANLQKARHILAVMRIEYSKLGLEESVYRETINGRIEAAVNSLELSGSQHNLLKTEFFFPEEPRPNQHDPSFPLQKPSQQLSNDRFAVVNLASQTKPSETVGEQIDRCRQECNLTVEELAEKMSLDPTNVSRHIRGETTPNPRNRRKYGTVFSKLLKKEIVINKTQVKRS